MAKSSSRRLRAKSNATLRPRPTVCPDAAGIDRDPAVLARHRNYRCKKSEAEIATALRGDWQREHLFTLRQSLEAWRRSSVTHRTVMHLIRPGLHLLRGD